MSILYFIRQFLYKYSFIKLDSRYHIITIGTKICQITFAVGLRHQITTAELWVRACIKYWPENMDKYFIVRSVHSR